MRFHPSYLILPLTLLLGLATASLIAAEPAEEQAPVMEQEAPDAGQPIEAPLPPELPPQVQSGEALEPEVTIRETEEGTVTEYSIGGRIYMVKIVPGAGPAYYLIDSNGDGELDSREDDITTHHVPQWVLFSW